MANPADSRYFGDVAATYEAQRRRQRGWKREDRTLREFMADLPDVRTVLDLPCGTGRWLTVLRHVDYTGVDISHEMLDQARPRLTHGRLIESDVFTFIASNHSRYDLTICTRFLNFFTARDARAILTGLVGMSDQAVVFTVRVRDHWIGRELACRPGTVLGSRWRRFRRRFVTRPHPRRQVERWVRDAGWRIDEVRVISGVDWSSLELWLVRPAAGLSVGPR